MSSVATADFQTRMTTLKQIAKVTGVRLPETIIPEGESLIPYGEQRQRALKDEVYALPTIAEAGEFVRAVRREQAPMDVTVPLQMVRMNPLNGGLYGPGLPSDKALGYSPVGFLQASSAVKPDSVTTGVGATLLALPPAIRADAFNYFAINNPRERNVVLRTIAAPQHMNGGGYQLRRSVSAVVSEKYTAVEDHDLIADLEAKLPAGARVRYTSTESRSDVEILWPAMDRQLKVGDIALIALHVSNSQTAQSCIRLVPKVLRVLCLNFTTAWGEGMQHNLDMIHTGDTRTKFLEALKSCLETVEPFVKAFGDAYQIGLPVETPTRAEVVERTVKAFALPAKFGKAIVNAWDADGDMSAGDTLAGLANAITRASQEMPIERADDVEEAAGRLVRVGWEALNN